ncbi:MAG: nitrogenase iron-molybdenum cofactor biosynthesis protein NifE [Clostridia bacterium]|nr:nitrogenase iron-molybdenum cofactor biosynthesis protein NifE [Clostridia bacterium]
MLKQNQTEILEERKDFIICNSQGENSGLKCGKDSVAGSVSQRACVYCGARVVLNPITDAFHIVHGPIGCASYTWDIRGSLSSGEEVYRNSFSTDLREKDVVFGGEKKLEGAIEEIVQQYSPKLIFVYSTCIVGVIGDDIEAVCKKMASKHSITIIPVQSSGFIGNKSMGYKAACNALLKLMESRKDAGIEHKNENSAKINFLGDFNLAGEIWIVKNYFSKMGIEINAKITGDSTYEEILRAPEAELNIVQCAGSMTYLAKEMEVRYGIPFTKVSFFGIEDTKYSLMRVAEAMGDKKIAEKAKAMIFIEELKTQSQLEVYRKRLEGKKAAIYVGGGFKAISLIKQFRDLGIKTVMVGTQTGREEEYEIIKSIADPGTVILDDTNPSELEKFIKEKGADILVGGVKERPLAYKLGISFCDHNHERKHPLCGFEGAVNFAKEVDLTINSPVWRYTG